MLMTPIMALHTMSRGMEPAKHLHPLHVFQCHRNPSVQGAAPNGAGIHRSCIDQNQMAGTKFVDGGMLGGQGRPR